MQSSPPLPSSASPAAGTSAQPSAAGGLGFRNPSFSPSPSPSSPLSPTPIRGQLLSF